MSVYVRNGIEEWNVLSNVHLVVYKPISLFFMLIASQLNYCCFISCHDIINVDYFIFYGPSSWHLRSRKWMVIILLAENNDKSASWWWESFEMVLIKLEILNLKKLLEISKFEVLIHDVPLRNSNRWLLKFKKQLFNKIKYVTEKMINFCKKII